MVVQAVSQAQGAYRTSALRLRRRDLAVLGPLSAAALCAMPARAAASVLRVLSWPGYADPDIVAAFEKRHAVRVEITTVASDDVMRAKLAHADVNVEVEIPLDEATPSDITDQVADYFKLGGEADETEVVTASLTRD